MAAPSFVFAHLADAHVGAWARDPGIRRALRESVLRALRVVRERRAEFLLISGDLFHTPVPDPGEAAPVAASLRELTAAGCRVYVIYGSHDYVAHRTSWLDVLAETGIFLRAAPEAVRSEGSRWTLPFLVDGPTGAGIAGISGRSHGLDRSYFTSVDSEAFRQHPGFKIFQFHAAVDDYLPEGLREHIHGIRRSDLPGGCDYYAGGHIHQTYLGEGPDGGLLVNPGAVFGTSITDLENGQRGRTHQGVVIVTVRDGLPTPEFVDTAPRDTLRIFDVDISGQSVEEARSTVQARLAEEAAPGAILLPRVHGTPADGSIGAIGLGRRADGAVPAEVAAVHWDLRDTAPVASPDAPEEPEGAAVDAALAALRDSSEPELRAAGVAPGSVDLRGLLRELAIPLADGEGRLDYESARVGAALRILGVGVEPAREG
jgi:DNA repair protein SbcD/Mre11